MPPKYALLVQSCSSNPFGGANVDIVPPNIQSDTGDTYVFRDNGRLKVIWSLCGRERQLEIK